MSKQKSDKVEVKSQKVQSMFGSIASTYDLVNSVLSGGIHLYWQHALFSNIQEDKSALGLDLCSGTGALVPGLKKKCKDIVAVDFCSPMLKRSKQKYANIHHVQGDALSLSFSDKTFDVITIAYGVRNFENLAKGLSEVSRVLKPGGEVHILEFGQPRPGLWKYIFDFYSKKVMPFLGGLISGNKDAYTYLPATSASFPCKQEFLDILAENNFIENTFKSLTGGIAYIYKAKKK